MKGLAGPGFFLLFSVIYPSRPVITKLTTSVVIFKILVPRYVYKVNKCHMHARDRIRRFISALMIRSSYRYYIILLLSIETKSEIYTDSGKYIRSAKGWSWASTDVGPLTGPRGCFI